MLTRFTILNKFNDEFGIPRGCYLMKDSLEEAIIKKYGSIQYFYHKKVTLVSDYMEVQEFPEHYSAGTNFFWEDNKISTKGISYISIEEALMGLLLENKRKFKGIVNKVYEKVKE